MSAVNISFEEAKAKLWKQEVEAELELVAKINAEAGRCMQDLNEEGDPLTTILKRTGSAIESFGNKLREKFNEAMTEVGKAILKYSSAHEDIKKAAQSASMGQN